MVEHQLKSQAQEEHPWLAEGGSQSHVLGLRSRHIRRSLGQQREVGELIAKEQHRQVVVVAGRRSRCHDGHHSSHHRRGDLCHQSVRHDPEPMVPRRRWVPGHASCSHRHHGPVVAMGRQHQSGHVAKASHRRHQQGDLGHNRLGQPRYAEVHRHLVQEHHQTILA